MWTLSVFRSLDFVFEKKLPHSTCPTDCPSLGLPARITNLFRFGNVWELAL